MAGAAAAAAQEAAQQAAEEKGRLLVELEEAYATLTAAASAGTDSSAASLADQLKVSALLSALSKPTSKCEPQQPEPKQPEAETMMPYNAHSSISSCLDASEQEAHEALYEMEMATLEAQRVAQATQAALEDSDDEEELMRIAAATAQQQASPFGSQSCSSLRNSSAAQHSLVPRPGTYTATTTTPRRDT